MAVTRGLLATLSCIALYSQAAQLPEERGDAMYHSYDGGGVTVDGPSLLVRKNFKETVSVSANYYVDNISSASIDVVTSGASAYSEKRTEYSVGANYLYDKSIVSAGLSNSDESDYQADTYFFSVSQDFFGDLSNITFGYARSEDEVYQNGNNDFAEEIERDSFRLSFNQIVTPTLIMGINYELITDEGYLNNPYRSYRYLTDPLDTSAGYQLEQEVYPATRTSDAVALRFMYHLPWRASLGGNYRFFTDDWGIDAHSGQLGYTHVLRDHWTLDFKYRYYQQTAADFYSDLFLFPSQDEKDYRARDKELSEFDNHTLSFHLSYDRPLQNRWTDRAGVSLQLDRIWFSYDNFSDLTDVDAEPGTESLYEFEADVIKLLFTVWY
ncbi:MAG: DUF3570 domain-containing protein [Halioglobus sp.]